MTNAIVPQNNQNSLSTEQQAERLRQASQVADKMASQNRFTEFRQLKSENTLRAHDRDLKSFADMLNKLNAGVFGVQKYLGKGNYEAILENDTTNYLNVSPEAWKNITYGFVNMFRQQMLNSGYAIGTINRRLCTVRKYAGLAYEADVIDTDTIAKIKIVSGYSSQEATKVNEKRAQTRITDDTGQPVKKADSVRIPADAIDKLKHKHDTSIPLGLRNRAMMCLLLEHGLRASEIVDLKASDIDLAEGTMTFYRRKVNKTQTHTLTSDSLRALSDYMPSWLTGDMPLFLGIKRNGEMDNTEREKVITYKNENGETVEKPVKYIKGITTRTVTRIVNELGQEHGIERLSAHDCRHSWATRAAKCGTSSNALKQAGGWNSNAMPDIYIDDSEIANEGVILSN